MWIELAYRTEVVSSASDLLRILDNLSIRVKMSQNTGVLFNDFF